MKNIDAVLLIRKEVVKGSNLAFEAILKLPELKRYYLGLKYVSTSNNAICKAMNIPIEAGTRYKAELESNYNLVASPDNRYSDESTPLIPEQSTPRFRNKVRHLFRSKVHQSNRPLSSLSKDDIFQS